MGFVHLNIHSEFTLLESACRIEKLTDRAQELGMDALAITDRNVMYGVIPFYKSCHKKGIKPIIGLEVDVVDSSAGNDQRQPAKLLLYAMNHVGYQNLIKISSSIQAESRGTTHILALHDLHTYCEGVLAVTSGVDGVVQRAILNGGQHHLNILAQLKNMFEDNLYIGLEDHGVAKEKDLNLTLIQLSKETDVPIVVINNIHYMDQEDASAYEALRSIKLGKKLNEDDDLKRPTDEHYFKTSTEMEELFSHVPDAMKNTSVIAEKCHVTLNFGTPILPAYPIPEKESSESYLRKVCEKGVLDRYGQTPSNQVLERMKYELDIINRMGFNDYFLIVWDFMKYAQENNIMTGPGRGSAAGSLVSYVLSITQVDPIEHELLFERFLNPERVSMPDIDIDFPDTKRDEVIEYVAHKYGKDRVAQIITFGTLAARAALRDVGRVLNLDTQLIDRVAKQVPSRPGITLDQAIKESPLLKKTLDQSEDAQHLWRISKTVEGIPRHASTHAAGIVISKDPLTNVVPTQSGGEFLSLTQYTMEGLEEIGLLKMDFLGLRNLTLLENITASIKKSTGDEIPIQQIPFQDEATFQLLAKGDTTGIFQLESEGMRKVLKKLKPTEFEDIVAVNALYRPGPMENIPVYIERKHKQNTVEFPHPDLEPILKKTYGVIVYQEQIMQIASKMAGFSLGEADLLRRAVSKKKADVLHEQRNHFVNGAMNQGYDRNSADQVYDLIVRFANYGFNRSHAVAYSVIAYQLAYLKANYSVYFLAELLSSIVGNHGKIAAYLGEIRQSGVEVLSPSINSSSAGFKVESEGIRIGLMVIKNVGVRAIESILEERKKGPYQNLFDLCRRVSLKVMNKRSLESLILAGSLDEFTTNRAQLLANLDAAIEYGSKIQKAEAEGQIDFFQEDGSNQAPRMEDVPPFQDKEQLQFEYEALGFYLTGHPIEQYSQILIEYECSKIAELKQSVKKVRIGALIEKSKQIKTKKGDWMAFVQFGDATGEIEGIVFPKAYKQNPELYQEGNLLLLEGNVEQSEDIKFIVEKAVNLSTLSTREKNQNLYLKIESSKQEQGVMHQIKEIVLRYPGNADVILYYEHNKKVVRLSKEFSIDPVEECVVKFESLLGTKNVVLK
ncbi:DNA polymerase III subunit alpha [Pseudalkalibacillus berkeleyi]|uniref:DNA-directed DNA polymerase n=1 Tax=Pseudalkalibacillus berkeleyi TaxID=1069813 RepID=A0ABS9H2R8_9BACL|nr:DNA polymerase III subunit alpha [Pseudalkalibacillus berkeleyi]MCF6138209.1 DNA polymerase III subunit alpha [Pseudalkalibacillus berkeleyi]